MSVVLFALLPVVPAAAQTCPFDDGNSQLTREGLVLTRYALGLTGSALVNGTDFLPADAPTIQSSIACPSCGLNITGNTDGLGNPVVTVADATIISRKLAGMSGAALTNGVNLGAGTRNTTSAVNSFLLAGCGATGGTVTSITLGTGMTSTANPITTVATIGVDTGFMQRRVSGTCAAGSSIRTINQDGTVVCQADTSGGSGTVTSVASGTGLTGGPITSAGTLALATAYQLPQACSNGAVPKSNGAGGWVCGTDNAPINPWTQGGNAFGAPGVIGTTDAQPLTVQAGASQVSLVIPNGNGLRVLRGTINAAGYVESPIVINGSSTNFANGGDAAVGSTIAGGGSSETTCADTLGLGNTNCRNETLAQYATIGGGRGNRARLHGVVGGGYSNGAGGFYSTVGGGNRNSATGAYSAVAGGQLGDAGGDNSVIGGGYNNSVQTGTFEGVIAGGDSNIVAASYGSIGGGIGNSIAGQYATIPGGASNSVTGNYGFAAGRNAVSRGTGMFVWSDSTGVTFDPAASGSFGSSNANVAPLANTFIVRATGGVQFATGVNGSGIITQSCYIGPAGTGWTCASDRNLKHLIKEV